MTSGGTNLFLGFSCEEERNFSRSCNFELNSKKRILAIGKIFSRIFSFRLNLQSSWTLSVRGNLVDSHYKCKQPNFEASSKDRKQMRHGRGWSSFGEIYLSLIEQPPTSNNRQIDEKREMRSNDAAGRENARMGTSNASECTNARWFSWCSHPVELKTRLRVQSGPL